MKRVVFEDPMLNIEENPDQEFLKDLIFKQGDDFWDVGSEEAALNFYENGDEGYKSYIHLKGLEDQGFMIKHSYRGDNEDLHSLRFGEHNGETVEASIAGDPKLYYREYFVPREVAWEAIEYFLETGDRKPDLEWEIARYPAEVYGSQPQLDRPEAQG